MRFTMERRSFKRQQSNSRQSAELHRWRTSTIFDVLELELLESAEGSVIEVYMQERIVRTARSSHGSTRR